MTQLTLHG